MARAHYPARRRVLAAVLVVAGAAGSRAARGQFGGPDLDTPFVTTPDNVVRTMLDLARLAPGERLIDLGSGDGRIVLEAARRGAVAHGVEIDPRLVAVSRAAAEREGLGARATFADQDLFATDFSAADVVTLYLLPDVNARLAPKLYAALHPGARIVSHDYGLGDWPADETVELDAPGKTVGRVQRSKVLRWTVPVRVAGAWTGRAGAEPLSLALRQQWQAIEGTMTWGGRTVPLSRGAVDGRGLELRAAADGSSIVLRLRAEGDRALVGAMEAAGGSHVVALRRPPGA